jgi:hypothetical protein
VVRYLLVLWSAYVFAVIPLLMSISCDPFHNGCLKVTSNDQSRVVMAKQKIRRGRRFICEWNGAKSVRAEERLV